MNKILQEHLKMRMDQYQIKYNQYMKNPKILRSLNSTIDNNFTIHSQNYFYKIYVNIIKTHYL